MNWEQNQKNFIFQNNMNSNWYKKNCMCRFLGSDVNHCLLYYNLPVVWYIGNSRGMGFSFLIFIPFPCLVTSNPIEWVFYQNNYLILENEYAFLMDGCRIILSILVRHWSLKAYGTRITSNKCNTKKVNKLCLITCFFLFLKKYYMVK